MSSSSGISSLTAKSQEKPSTFSQTCNRLSRYIKEQGCIGDINLKTSCTNETNGSSEMYQKRSITMNLFPTDDKLDNASNLKNMIGKAQPRKNDTFLNLFPMEDLSNMVHTHSSTAVNKSASEEKKRAQMTIFYGGRVYVFDDFPAEKAEHFMSFKKSCSRNHNVVAPSVAQNLQSTISMMVPTAVKSTTPPFSSDINMIPSTKNNLIQELNRQQGNVPVVRDTPIARNISLHRFLEKRKDRIASRAPYQINSFVSSPSQSAAAEGMPWLQLAAPASH